MEKKIEEQLTQFKNELDQLKEVVSTLDKQAEKRLESRLRERELEARILEAKTKWTPKDWFILTGIVSALIAILAGLVVAVVLAFSYVPPVTTTTTTTTVQDIVHDTDTTATHSATNTTNANFSVE